MFRNTNNKLGIALAGLGDYATHQLAPAFTQTEHCYLAGIFTGSPLKAAAWQKEYRIPQQNIYSYENFDLIKYNPEIDIIYVVLPNHLHAAYTIKAAQAGKHVICEKPMALSVAECLTMLAACKAAGKMLSIGYRLHFDPYHLELANIGQQKIYGDIKHISANFSITPPKGAWRLNKGFAGGGPLMDVGIYCIQAACYITGMEPVAVTAQSFAVSDKEKFIDVEETLNFQLEMPGGIIVQCRTSYSETLNHLKIETEKGIMELQDAFNFNGIKGTTPGGVMNFPALSQQAKQMDAFAISIKKDQPCIVAGEMGLRDITVITAVYEAVTTGKKVLLHG